MKKYLGETILDINKTKFASWSINAWVLKWIEIYGWIDGDHHKAWVLDQIARLLYGTKVIIKLAKWDDGSQEYRFNLDTPSETYLQWVKTMKAGEDGPDTYDYDVGIAP